MGRWRKLEQAIGYQFRDEKILEQAMRHSSYTNEHKLKSLDCNERLEFLGDAVLELISSEYLFHQYPRMPEGELTKLRASLVCEPSLAVCAGELSLGAQLLMGKGEECTGGRKRDSITSDALEALIGAIYLDGGFANAKEFILKFVLNDIEHKKLFYDSKTILQEMIQGRQEGELSYRIIEEKGPDHDKTFTAQVLVGTHVAGQGTGRTKKAAEQAAAYRAICDLKDGQVNHVSKVD